MYSFVKNRIPVHASHFEIMVKYCTSILNHMNDGICHDWLISKLHLNNECLIITLNITMHCTFPETGNSMI